MAPFSKPETVLKQAEGLVSVGQTHAALQSLTEMFSSKRFRSTPLTSLEPIMLRFIELCVEMRKGRTAKEGLMQYKNIAQNTSVQSIEVVITRFIQLADAKVREAQEKAAVQVAVDVDDLEASETPESILLGAVSGDQSKDRTDRALVTPWLKFLWESYRTSLETLKNNARLESIYQAIAQQAFKFCLKHQRKVEFRRLCETLRLHLGNVAKYSHQPHSINLSDPDTLQHHLDTRFAQLNTSVDLELWQEAFRSVEDVHNLLTLAKKAPRPTMMANYYEKLTRIFLMSGNALYHAAAWGRYYALVTSIGGKSDEELARLAGQVLVSALAVPVGLNANAEPEEARGRMGRLTALLGLTKTPTRSGLLKDALARNVLKLSPAPVKALYECLEVTFDPLTLCETIAPLLQTLSDSSDELETPYEHYLPLLHQALLSRLLSHLSQIYSSLKIRTLLDLYAPLRTAGVKGAYEDEQVEAYAMGCARRGELNVRVDHAEGCIVFVDEPFGLTPTDEAGPSSSSANTKDGRIQPSMVSLVRSRLSGVASCLHTSLQILDAPSPQEQEAAKAEAEAQSNAKLSALLAAVATERHALQLRRSLVFRRRELLLELSARHTAEEASRRAEQSRREKEEEAKRQREEMLERERKRRADETERIRRGEAEKYAKSLVEGGVLKSGDLEKIQQGPDFDTTDLIKMQVQQIEKDKNAKTLRLRVVGKRVDHLERAFRLNERPLLAQDYTAQQALDVAAFDQTQNALKDQARTAHADNLETKKRLSRIWGSSPDGEGGEYQKRKDVLIKKKGEEFAKKREAAQRKIEEEKGKRKKMWIEKKEEEKKVREEEDRKRREIEEEEARVEAERIAEEERVAAEEAAAAEAEAAVKRGAEEKAAAQRQAREAERAAAAEQARLQQQREEEAELRRQQRALERKQQQQTPAAEPASAWRRNGAASSNPGSVPSTPTRASLANSTPRSGSPAPAAAGPAAGKYRPGALGGGGGGWRAREAERSAAAAGGEAPAPANVPSRTASPAPERKEESAKDNDGFQAVEKKNVWRPRRLAGR